MKIIFAIAIFLASMLALLTETSANCNYTQSLAGNWKFSIGDNPQWANTSFNDSDWDNMYAPSPWEEKGYQGYNGIAWYRKSIIIPDSYTNRELTLELGYIDDCDEVYFNGEKIGQSGSFPPNYSTAYNAFRKYLVPNKLIKFGQHNLIAVRVYDAELQGGITGGDIQLCIGDFAITPDICLNGLWNFKTSWRSSNDRTIQVPGRWENQGYNDYDGIATYSITVKLTADQLNKKWIFMAGRIDDDDEFYINKQLVGRTGDIESDNNTSMSSEFRNYFIPTGILKAGENQIEIKVNDRGGEGGILEGNIGFISQDNFIKYWRLKRR